ncbi:hypothetical protein BGW42_003806 [Actinomortierella wolfii]|nr:hypothetical protein BGW42_003806 [Actinomortierella wolfii]
METMPAIATILPPRTRLHELKQSAHFDFEEVQHSIKTWVNMASLLVKQGLMAESQKDDENAYISYIRACMIMTKIIPHQACYSAMMNDIACIDLRQKILGIITRLGHLERRLLDKFEKDNQLQKQQQQQQQLLQQQKLQPMASTERFLRVASPEPPVIEARTSSLNLSRQSSTEPLMTQLSTSTTANGSERSLPSLPFSSDSDSASKEGSDENDDVFDDNGDNESCEANHAATLATDHCSPRAVAEDKFDGIQTRGEKMNDGARRAAVLDDGHAEEAEEDVVEEQDTNIIKVDMEQNSMPRRMEPPEILLLDEDDPILEYGAKDQICQARVQVNVVDDNEIVISERGSSITTVDGDNDDDHESELQSPRSISFDDHEDEQQQRQEEEAKEEQDIAQEETELTFDLIGTHQQGKATESEDPVDEDWTRARVCSQESLDLDLDLVSNPDHRRKFLQHEQKYLLSAIDSPAKNAARPRTSTIPLSFPAGNVLDDDKHLSATTTTAPRPRQSLTIYRTPSHERDERSAFYQHMPGLESNLKRTSHSQSQRVRRCSSSEALSRSPSVTSDFLGKYFPQSPPLTLSPQQQQQSQQQQDQARTKRISPPPRSPRRISVQILTHFPVSAPLPTPPPTHSGSFAQQMQQQQSATKLARATSVESTMRSNSSGDLDQPSSMTTSTTATATGRPLLSPSSPRPSIDHMSAQGHFSHNNNDLVMSPSSLSQPNKTNNNNSGSVLQNMYPLHRRGTLATSSVSTSSNSNSSVGSVSSSAYSSPVSSPMLVQTRQMSGGSSGGSMASSPLLSSSNATKTTMSSGTASTMTTMSACSDGSTAVSSSTGSNHAAMSSISSTITFATAASSVTLVSSRPETPTMTTSAAKLASSSSSTPASPAPSVTTTSTPTLHSFRKPGLLRKIRSRPKLGDNHVFEMVDTNSATTMSPPLGLFMHANANSSIRS